MRGAALARACYRLRRREGAVQSAAQSQEFDAIVVGSGNIAYRLALNSLLQALDSYEPVAQALRPTDPDGLLALGAAIAAGDTSAADAAARRLLEPDTGVI